MVNAQRVSARVTAIHLSPGRRQPVVPAESARALADFGLEGDAHARSGSDRQLLLMDQETLDELGLRSGDLKENITTAGLDLYSLPAGQLLRFGTAVFALTGPCAPCKLVDDLRPGLRSELAGRRGMLARVVESGEVRVGDEIEPQD